MPRPPKRRRATTRGALRRSVDRRAFGPQRRTVKLTSSLNRRVRMGRWEPTDAEANTQRQFRRVAGLSGRGEMDAGASACDGQPLALGPP